MEVARFNGFSWGSVADSGGGDCGRFRDCFGHGSSAMDFSDGSVRKMGFQPWVLQKKSLSKV